MQRFALMAVLLVLGSQTAFAAELRVAANESIQASIDVAVAGDVIVVEAGTYNESLLTARDGAAGAPIRLIAEGAVVVTNSGRVLRVEHAYFSVEGIVFDGQYGAADALNVRDEGDFFSLIGSEVRNTSRDCIDLGAPHNVTIDGCLIHHCLNAEGGRQDAHGIVGGAVRDLTIRNTEVHTFSGDAVQFDPGRDDVGWSGVVIDSCEFWLEPLPTAVNGFPAGTVPGENAVDTKVSANAARAIMTITNTIAHGFRGGLISNMAAFNMKEGVDATLDRVTVYDSEIAFRLRGPDTGANVLLTNAVVYDVDTAVRYEDNIEGLRIYHATFGSPIATLFDEASAASTVLDVRNSLMIAAALPAEASGASNLVVSDSAFVDSPGGDYHLAVDSPAIDVGVAIPEVTVDRDGRPRPHGSESDVGAYEFCEPDCASIPDAGIGGDTDASSDTDADGASGCGCQAASDSGPGCLLLACCLLAIGWRRNRTVLQR